MTLMIRTFYSRLVWITLLPLIARAATTTTTTDFDPPPFYVLNPHDYRSYFPDEASFQLAKDVAPFLDLPLQYSGDGEDDNRRFHDLLKAYYYRSRSYRKHIRRAPNYWVVTEFLPPVSWAGPDNTIAAAAGHHILEGRWFWDAPTFVEDYIRFWYLGGGSDSDNRRGENRNSKQWMMEHENDGHETTPHHLRSSLSNKQQSQTKQQSQPLNQAQTHISYYTNWIYYAAWQYGLLWGIPQTTRLFDDTFESAAQVFRDVYINNYLTNSTQNKARWNTTGRLCWTQDDGRDAMEVSVSGGGCRPTIASVLWGEATTLAQTAKLLGYGQPVVDEFSQWADFSQQVITQQHWNPAIDSFAVIAPPPQTGDYTPPSTCDLDTIRIPNEPVSVRELLAFMPWYYSNLLPLSSSHEQAKAWARQFQWLLQSSGTEGFTAPYGLRTVQRNTPCYNYSWTHGDCWNGPSWPYETSRVLTAIANLLIDHDNKPAVLEASKMTAAEFERLFQQYAKQHTQTQAVNDTAQPLLSGHIFENLHPDYGYWNNRFQMYRRNDTMKEMGDDYNHSTFLDIVFSSWLGIRTPPPLSSATTTTTTDDDDETQPQPPWLIVHPLIQAPYFAADRIPYRGRVLTIVYDPDGWHYTCHDCTNSQQRLQGLVVLVDGQVVAHRSDLGRLEVTSEPPSRGK